MDAQEQTRVGTQGHSHTVRWMGRRQFMTLMGGCAISRPLASYAQQPKPAPMKSVGVLSVLECPISLDTPFYRRLTELGWIEGKTLHFECVSTVGRLDQVQALARELVSRRPDVLLANTNVFIRALKQETTTIPIVMFSTPEPVRTGMITNLARPEGNVTGVAWFGLELLPKRIELLKELLPHFKRLAIMLYGYGDPKFLEFMEENLAVAANTFKFTWQLFRPVVANDYDEILSHLVAQKFDAAYMITDPLARQNFKRLPELALQHMIPTVCEISDWVKAGFLVSYGQEYAGDAARAAEYVDKILHGAKPGELPVEQPTKLELAINLKTAKALGIIIPPSILVRADVIIEE